MSAADEAWQRWHKDASNDGFVRRCQQAAFLAGYRRALEDAAKELHSTNSLAYPEWLAARAAAVAARETKD